MCRVFSLFIVTGLEISRLRNIQNLTVHTWHDVIVFEHFLGIGDNS